MPSVIRLSNQPFARVSARSMMAVAAFAVIAPQIAFAGVVLSDASVRQSLLAQPAAAIEASIAFVLWASIVCLPIHRWVSRASRSRTISIGSGSVAVIDRSPLRLVAWTAQLSEFIGVAHHIRSSISGARHEVVLAHPIMDKCLLLQAKETLSDADVLHWCGRLGLPLVPARAIYGRVGPAHRIATENQADVISPNVVPVAA